MQIKKPYWAKTCPIKTCTEGKGKRHCGECDKFACKQLHEFAFDPAEGNEGARIEQCEQWTLDEPI